MSENIIIEKKKEKENKAIVETCRNLHNAVAFEAGGS